MLGAVPQEFYSSKILRPIAQVSPINHHTDAIFKQNEQSFRTKKHDVRTEKSRSARHTYWAVSQVSRFSHIEKERKILPSFSFKSLFIGQECEPTRSPSNTESESKLMGTREKERRPDRQDNL